MRSVQTISVTLAVMLTATAANAETQLLDFYADWCGPCQQMVPAIRELEAAGYPVRRINVDIDQATARKYGVDAIPCFVAVADGKEVDRVVGVASVEQLTLKLRRTPTERHPPAVRQPAPRQPHPAWRYEEPQGHRAAVVRIYCQDDVRTRSIGSGCLVKWNGKPVVLTARHVVKDAKEVVVEASNKKTYRAHVLKVDSTWDCAVLELDGAVEGVEPAVLELGDAAMQQEGSRLESCGYGSDGKLACNSGLFLGYRRSTAALQGPDDWMVISGHAREGDSGGPVFNQHGRLVGVLWGTDGVEVAAVQAGRIQLVLNDALRERYKQQAALAPVALPRRPTLPSPAPTLAAAVAADSVPCANCQGGVCDVAVQVDANAPIKPRVLPYRSAEDKKLAAIDERLERISDLLLETARANESAKAEASKPDPTTPAKHAEASPLVAGLCIFAAIVVGFVIYFATRKVES